MRQGSKMWGSKMLIGVSKSFCSRSFLSRWGLDPIAVTCGFQMLTLIWNNEKVYAQWPSSVWGRREVESCLPPPFLLHMLLVLHPLNVSYILILLGLSIWTFCSGNDHILCPESVFQVLYSKLTSISWKSTLCSVLVPVQKISSMLIASGSLSLWKPWQKFL